MLWDPLYCMCTIEPTLLKEIVKRSCEITQIYSLRQFIIFQTMHCGANTDKAVFWKIQGSKPGEYMWSFYSPYFLIIKTLSLTARNIHGLIDLWKTQCSHFNSNSTPIVGLIALLYFHAMKICFVKYLFISRNITDPYYDLCKALCTLCLVL